ncbi:hypothetical protein XBKB1_680005 [Xenorhabdus bovienii str. kraussei Becker Underwood]|uniref:Uncharacterized protein n=1 Tax=Xenorhabdus bovienii str. kraussei Becker Underwood TaxID=1398204 RepID=A0A077Q094_XENBV|nr:hypothetical protein XBKB1_680005 [Xenorhabdus bovienii str. kraussei Becker Underwood]
MSSLVCPANTLTKQTREPEDTKPTRKAFLV